MPRKKRVSIACTAAILLLGSSPAISAPIRDRTVDIVSVTWPGAKSLSVSVNEVERSLVQEVSPNWRAFTASQGAPGNTAVNFVPGIVSSVPLKLPQPMVCEGNAFMTFMSTVQREFYRFQKIADYNQRYLLILIPNTGCVWLGKAIMGEATDKGGVVVLHNSASSFVITHEIGHTLGLGHTNYLSCADGQSDGNWNKCDSIEYGGTIDVMGNVETSSPLSTYHQWRIGLLDNSVIHQSWLNETITLSGSDVFGATRAIFIRDGDSSYWIEYRRGNSKYKPGLAIFRTDPPPLDSVVSPNPESIFSAEYTSAVTSDLWMLNWDNYTYTGNPTSAAGSMTLPKGKTAKVFRGGISISAQATSDPSFVSVSIVRSPDKTPPPTPVISNPNLWRSSDTDIVIKGKEDKESRIDYFQLKIDGKVSLLRPKSPGSWLPTYLNPLTPNPSVFVRDLPNGSYNLAIRSIDVWGNVSPWSTTKRVEVDGTAPNLSSSIKVEKIDKASLTFALSGALDEQSGLCDSSLANSDGWITARSKERRSPTFSIPFATVSSLDAAIFDCFGNGISAKIKIQTTPILFSMAIEKIGKWSTPETDNLSCKGNCSILLSVSGSVAVSLSSGRADLKLGADPVVKASTKSPAIIYVGNRKSLLKIRGSNFTISRILQTELSLSKLKEIAKTSPPIDASLLVDKQKELARKGFRNSDFGVGWSVIPKMRGTALIDPSFDLCSNALVSDSGRVARRQVVASNPESNYSLISTEVIEYANSTSAANALSEISSSAAFCLQNQGVASLAGTFNQFSFNTIPRIPSGLVPNGNRVIINASFRTEIDSNQILALYQKKDRFITGMYVMRPGPIAMTEVEISRWLEVAKTLATRI